MDEEFADAELVLREALRLASHLNERRYMSLDKRQLANIYWRTGRTSLARQTAKEALDLFETLGMTGRAEATRRILQEMQETSHCSENC